MQQDLVDRFGESELLIAADLDGDGVIDATAVQKALDQATNEIDAWVGERYGLPLPQVPDIVVDKCCDIAFYKLSFTAGKLTEEKRKRYEDAIALLKAISARKASLGIAEKEEESVGGGVTVVRSGTRLFTRDAMRGLR